MVEPGALLRRQQSWMSEEAEPRGVAVGIHNLLRSSSPSFQSQQTNNSPRPLKNSIYDPDTPSSPFILMLFPGQFLLTCTCPLYPADTVLLYRGYHCVLVTGNFPVGQDFSALLTLLPEIFYGCFPAALWYDQQHSCALAAGCQQRFSSYVSRSYQMPSKGPHHPPLRATAVESGSLNILVDHCLWAQRRKRPSYPALSAPEKHRMCPAGLLVEFEVM